MKSTIGLWIAILALAIAAAYGNIQYFKQQTAMQLNSQLLRTANVTYLVDECKNENIKKLLAEEILLRDELEATKLRVAAAEGELRNARLARDREQRNAERAVGRMTELDEQRKNLEERLVKTEKEADNIRERAAGYDVFLADKERYEAEINKLAIDKSELEGDNEKLAQEREGLIKSARNRINNLQTANADLKTVLTKQGEEVRKRGEATKVRSDTVGRILEVDIANKFCVVDLGSVNNVRRGMRFEVGRWMLNQWKPLAMVELIKVNPTTSTAMIIDETTEYKQCPITGYIAKSIEEVFSPYAASRLGEAVKLITIKRDAVSTMKESDPIIKGDQLRSKIYQRDRKLRFAFVGEPVSYSEDILRSHIVAAGNIYQDDINTDTDFLIVGKVEDVQEADLTGAKHSDALSPELEMTLQIAKKAREAQEYAARYGIPIMREVELNEFLRN